MEQREEEGEKRVGGKSDSLVILPCFSAGNIYDHKLPRARNGDLAECHTAIIKRRRREETEEREGQKKRRRRKKKSSTCSEVGGHTFLFCSNPVNSLLSVDCYSEFVFAVCQGAVIAGRINIMRLIVKPWQSGRFAGFDE